MKIAVLLFAAVLLIAAPSMAQDQAEVAFWETVKDSKNPEEIQAYIDGYPSGKFVPLARIRLRSLQGGAGATPAQPAQPAAAPVPAGPVGNNGLTASKGAFAPFEEMKLSWAGIKAGSGSVGIGAPGETKLVQMKSVVFTSEPSGSFTFPGLVTGKYEARILTGSYGSETVVARVPIEVRDPPEGAAFRPRIATEKPNFGPMEKIVVSWADIRPPNGSIALFQEGNAKALDSLSVTFLYEKRFTGRHEFAGRPPGKYEVRVLTGEYGKEAVIARAPLTVGDAGAAQVAAAPGAVGAPAVVQLGPVVVSEIGSIVLAYGPRRREDEALSAKILAAAPSLKCADTELYVWQIADQQKLDTVIGTTAQAMRVRGYNVNHAASDGGLVFAAAGVVPLVRDRALYALWTLQPGGLHLLLCRVSPK